MNEVDKLRERIINPDLKCHKEINNNLPNKKVINYYHGNDCLCDYCDNKIKIDENNFKIKNICKFCNGEGKVWPCAMSDCGQGKVDCSYCSGTGEYRKSQWEYLNKYRRRLKKRNK